ncbi:MAG: hypothetical protein JSV30_06775 [Candidatus Omnitrophota bacterium]|nr:MAG: hypothetical protein JSV30_06775 [Candidatus Omnitrophota bacterium]
MNVTPLNTRRKEILQSIVELYIESAIPVSSQAVARRLEWRISAATVRNVMAELVDLGLLWQPHTSAGRVPTDSGYRYYINSLLEIEELTRSEQELIESGYPSNPEAFDELLTGVLQLLSNVSRYTAFAFSALGKERLYITGTSYILEQPEFQDARKLQGILRTFERQEPLLEIIKEDLAREGVKVHIGGENPYEDIRECSLVISNYKIKDTDTGALGIIGPRRMSYAKAISTVDYIARTFSAGFSDIE